MHTQWMYMNANAVNNIVVEAIGYNEGASICYHN